MYALTRCIHISIHAPVKGATVVINRGRPIYVISIHAPVKGATQGSGQGRVYQSISIHAPVKGATAWRVHSPCVAKHFNPRSREGSDFPWERNRLHPTHFNPRSREGSDAAELHRPGPRTISIHAPVKGATAQ